MSTTKTAAHRHQHSKHGEQRVKPASKPMSDRSVYWGIFIVGFFVVMLGWLLSEGTFWRQTLLGYSVLVILNINFAGWDAVRGKRLVDWKQSLAKIPLRFAGFGTTDGKPVESAHDQPAAKRVMVTFGLTSALVAVGLSVLMLWRW